MVPSLTSVGPFAAKISRKLSSGSHGLWPMIKNENWCRTLGKEHVFRFNSVPWQPFSNPIFVLGCLGDRSYCDTSIATMPGLDCRHVGIIVFLVQEQCGGL